MYARNIAHGHGLVYYAGGERVEGFTSPAWVMICAAVTALTAHPEPVLVAIDVVLLVIAGYSLAAYLRDFLTQHAGSGRLESESIAVLLAAVVLLAPAYLVWSTISLMDSGLWSAVLLLAEICVLRIAMSDAVGSSQARHWLLLLMPVLALVRPEAMLWGPTLLSIAVFAEWSAGKTPGDALRVYVPHAALFAAVIAALTMFRLMYFGYPLPNTYYAKMGADPAGQVGDGLKYFADFALANPAFPIALAMAAVTLAVSRDRPRLKSSQTTVLVLLGVSAAVPVIEGGDHFGFWRMLQPAWPLVAIQAVHSRCVLFPPEREQSRRRALLLYAAAVMLAAMSFTFWPVLPRLSYPSHVAAAGDWNTPRLEISIAKDMRDIGSSFNRAFPSFRPSVAVIVAGGFALAYPGPVIDLMGLNNVAMAHSRAPRTGLRGHTAFDPDMFFTLLPDIVLLSLWSPSRPDWFDFPMVSGVFDALPETAPDYWQRRAVSMAIFDAGVLKGLLKQRRMAEQYAWASVRPAAAGPWIHAIFSRRCLARLNGLGYTISYPVMAR